MVVCELAIMLRPLELTPADLLKAAGTVRADARGSAEAAATVELRPSDALKLLEPLGSTPVAP